ncbi:hypothetical protein R3P38DRAFT_2759447 [Favolaschia claudopus]|uniref:Uncharacterized protein n=1 Tax=Favolaschia claudopus TaxID=2862362 RepID=A0AAW0DW40_9AGAR
MSAIPFPDEELKAPKWAPSKGQDPDKDRVDWVLFKKRVPGCDLSSSLWRRFGPARVLEQGDTGLGNTSALRSFDELAHRNLQNTTSSGEDLTLPSANSGMHAQPTPELPPSVNVDTLTSPENGRALAAMVSLAESLQLDQKEKLDLANNIIKSHLKSRQITRTWIIDQAIATQELAQRTASPLSDSTRPKNSLERDIVSPNLCAALEAELNIAVTE